MLLADQYSSFGARPSTQWKGASAPSLGSGNRVPNAVRRYATLYGACFALYAIFGRSFAYVGIPPLFVGEMLLAAGILVGLRASLKPLARSPLGSFMILFSLWQIFCTLPHLVEYGLDTLRDAAAWYYAAFAWIVAAILIRYPILIEQAIERYRRFSSWYVFLGPLAALTTWYLLDVLPTIPGSGVKIPELKIGDMQVHLAGITAFFLVGLAPRKQWWLIPAFAGAAVGGTRTRGGLLAFLCATILTGILRRRSKQVLQMTGACVGVILLLVVSGIQLSVPGTARKISADQVLANVTSIVGGDTEEDLDGTKQWRLNWWNKIIDYTVYGPYFWMGKGYGINLSESDGFQVESSLPLRSPHNSHLTFLARSGVPGLCLWVLFQLTWLSVMARCFIRSARLGLSNWAALFTWTTAYWLAFMINASFDVSLEGPMSAIPFWTIFGFGWASSIVFSKRLRAMPPDPHNLPKPDWTKRARRFQNPQSITQPI